MAQEKDGNFKQKEPKEMLETETLSEKLKKKDLMGL